jgi:hypothetical protein
MTVIGVSRGQIITYASEAEEQFGRLRTALDSLVNDSVNVNYWGENAQGFKTNVGQAAVTMSEEIGKALRTFLGQVNAQTSAIARSLGGGDMSVDIAVPTVSLPAIPTADGDTQGVDTSALDGLQDAVNTHRDTINTAISEHQAALGRTTEWVGDSKVAAQTACQTFTTNVTSSVQTGIAKITGFITEQNAAAAAADRA